MLHNVIAANIHHTTLRKAMFVGMRHDYRLTSTEQVASRVPRLTPQTKVVYRNILLAESNLATQLKGIRVFLPSRT
jgi:hypothetical protein